MGNYMTAGDPKQRTARHWASYTSWTPEQSVVRMAGSVNKLVARATSSADPSPRTKVGSTRMAESRVAKGTIIVKCVVAKN